MKTHPLTTPFALVAQTVVQLALLTSMTVHAATLPYFEDFEQPGIPSDFFTVTGINSGSFPATDNRWSVSGGVMRAANPTLTPATPERSKALVGLTNAYDTLISGAPVVMSADVNIESFVTSAATQAGISMFVDTPLTDSGSGSFFGTSGWDALIRVDFSSNRIRLAIWDYAGTDGNGAGAGVIAGTTSGSTGIDGADYIDGITYDAAEFYTLTMIARLISSADIQSGGGTELDDDLGKVRVTLSFTDPDNGSGPYTASISGVSHGLASLQANSDQQFGFYTSNAGGSSTFPQVVQFDNLRVVVPEPSCIALAAFAMVGLISRRNTKMSS